MKSRTALVHIGRIERRVVRLRGHNVILDTDLAVLYGVPAKALNQAVKRNRERFPADFMFRLTHQEAESMRSQIVTAKRGRGGRRTPPYAFTEQGVAMLSSVLRSDGAVRVNIEIMRTFVRVRQLLEVNARIAMRVYELERKCNSRFAAVFEAIRELSAPPRTAALRRIGFATHPDDAAPRPDKRGRGRQRLSTTGRSTKPARPSA